MDVLFKIKTLNNIADCGLKKFDATKYIISDNEESPEGIILRSFDMHTMEIMQGLLAIARAGAGVNNIPIDKCSEKGIVVFNTPGANANAVKELAIASLLLSSRKIIDGINWVNTLAGSEDVPKLVEKGKSKFIGPELEGKTLGVFGLGAIGVMVANSALALGMEVIGYDPYISVDAAWGLSRNVKRALDAKSVLESADYITLHVPLNNETRGMINDDTLGSCKDGIRIINLSRGDLVNDDAIEKALESGKAACYVTDFPNDKTLKMKNVIAIPHLGASTPESEDNCAVMACRQLIEYLEGGNIINSVNFPETYMPKSASCRLCIAHKNIPNMLSQFSGLLALRNINIEDLLNKSKKELAYTLIDTNASVSDEDVDKLKGIEGVLSVRVIR